MAEKRITVWVQRFKDRATLQLQWIDPDTGRRRTRSAGTADPEAAEQARADLEYELAHGKYQEASRMTWGRFRELFEEEYVAARRARTRANYGTAFDLFEELCRPGRLRSVTERTVSAYAAAMRRHPGYGGRDGLLPSTIKLRLQLLRTALRWAADQGLLPKCPKFLRVKVPRKKPQPVPAESFERLVAKAPDAPTKAFLLCGWLGGLRLGEALALEWEAGEEAPYLDPANDRIVLPAEFAKAAEDQWVPLDPLLWEALRQLPRQGRQVFRFVSHNTGKPLTLSGMSVRIIKLARRAGVKLSMHALRKGFGCRYAARVPAQVLQRLMRHSNISITVGYYSNVDDAVMQAVLGPQRNGLRDTPAPAAPPAEGAESATGSAEGR